MPDPVNLAFAMNLPPEKVIEYFESKGYAISFRWDDLAGEAHKKAFTAAGAMNQDILEGIRGAMDEAIKEGQTFRQFQSNLQPTLKNLGWWGEQEIVDPDTGEIRTIDVTPHRLRNIYRTNMRTSYATGRMERQQEVMNSRPYWMYSAVGDAATRTSHAAMHNIVLRADDPWWLENYPPNGWGCRCQVVSLSQRALERRGLEVIDGSSLENIAEDGWRHNPGA